MRLIEQQMLAALTSMNDFRKNNTEVSHNIWSNISVIRLHGNDIATYNHDTEVMTPNLKTLKEWPTNTTKSRLRALGVTLATRKGVIFIDDVEV